MTGLLIKLFIKNPDDTTSAEARTRYGFLASAVCIACNVALSAAKATAGILTGSLAVVADAVNNLSDASSNIVSLLGFKLASKPADSDHPYGHGRFEYLAGLAVAALIAALGLNLVKESVGAILSPSPTTYDLLTVAILVGSMLVKLWMMAFNRSIGRRIDSETLMATAADSRNDVVTTGAILACAAISQLTGVSLDSWAGLGVGIFVLVSGVGLIRDTVSPLLGQAPSKEFVEQIRAKILSYPGVLGTHDLMVHDYGPGRVFASAHVEMAGEGDAFEHHDTLDNIEQDFKDSMGIIMTLHYDPIVTNDPEVKDMRHWIDEQVRRIDPRLSIHDLRRVPGPTHTNVIFDCVRPSDLGISDRELRERIQNTVVSRYPDALCKITLDSSYVSSEQ